MLVPGHAQVGWHLAEAAGLGKKDRILCAVAGMSPDLDGFAFLLGLSNYWEFHHTFGHSLLIIPFMAVALGLFARKKLITMIFCCFGALAHVAVDIFGSMPVYVLWPLYPDWTPFDNPNPFIVFPVEFITPFLMIACSMWVYRKRGISILEIFGSRMEKALYGWFKRIHAGPI